MQHDDLKPKLVRTLHITHTRGIAPEEETHVPCPVCKTGMVPASTAIAITHKLAQGSDGPEAPSSGEEEPPESAG